MSSDYHRQIVVAWDGKIPMDEHGCHLDIDTLTPVESTPYWNYREHKPYKKIRSARKIALDNVCKRELLGNRRKFYWATELTNPYGCLHWAIGSGDDFTCFDYAELPDGRIVLSATFNTETGCYIGGCGYEVVSKEDAPNVAERWVGEGLDTAAMNGTRHAKRGWNQDPYFFYRCVKLYCDEDAPTFSDRQKRLGGKRINKYCGLPLDLAKATW